MSPPIRDGSGNSIGSIRLGDGTEISEVRTGAGDVLFSAGVFAQDIAQFERGSLHPSFEGDTGRYEVNNSSPVLYETQSLRHTTGNDNEFIHSRSGLDRYPQQDQRFACYIYLLNNEIAEVGWAGDNLGDYYTFSLSVPTDELLLNRFDGNSRTELTSRVPQTISDGIWYDAEIEWLSNGSITARVFEVDQSTGERSGSALESISSSDTNHTGDGIAFRSGSPGDFVADNYRILEDLS